MIGKIEGANVFLSEDQLPEFSVLITALEDPSKTKGSSSTTIRVINTPEAARALGTEHMHDAPRTQRPRLRIGNGSVDFFTSRVIPVRHSRNEIECIAVGGNAAWFEYAKSTRLRAIDLGVTDEVSAAFQRDSWSDEDSIACFPLVDYGSLEGRDNTYNVASVKLLPAIRVKPLFEAAFREGGFTIRANGALQDVWGKLIMLQGEDAYVEAPIDEITSSQQATSTVTCVTSIEGDAPGWWRRSGGGLNTPWEPLADEFEQHYATPYDTRIRIQLTNLKIVSVPMALDGTRLAFVLYDKAAGYELGRIYTDVLTGGADYTLPTDPLVLGEFEVDEASHLDVGIINETGSTVSITIGNDVGGVNAVTFRPLYRPYTIPSSFTAPLVISSACPDITLAEAISGVANALCLVFVTNEELGTVDAWFDYEYFRKPSKSITTRDWTSRMDHSSAPSKVVPNSPANLTLEYKPDANDKLLKTSNVRLLPERFAAATVQIGGIAKDQTLSVEFGATAMNYVLGGLLVPVIRRLGAEYQTDDYTHIPRLLIIDGVAEGEWKHQLDVITEYPVTYFVHPDPSSFPLHFDNGAIYVTPPEGSIYNRWKPRIDRMRSRILEAHFTIHDHEVQDFDHGMPTLVDDGSGPRWYYVQEIMAHRFGLGAPTRCRLVEIPGADVQASEVVNPRITYPSQPFACVGRGYASLVCDSSPAPHVFTSTGYLAMRNASSGLVEVFGTGGAGEFQPNPSAGGTYCMWACDSLGNPAGMVTQLRVGDDSGPVTSMDLQGWTALTVIDCDEALNLAALTLGSKPVLTTLTASYTVLEELDLSGCSVLTDFVANNVEELETITPPPNVTLELVNVSFCGLDSASVNGLALKCNPAVAGSFDSGSGTNGPPTGAGAAYLATLLATPLTITGAGEAAVNDTYTLNGTILGHDAYLSGGGIAIYFAGFGGWIITDEVNTYYTTETPDDPWDVVTWQTDGGFAAPAPTLTAPSDGLWTVNTN